LTYYTVPHCTVSSYSHCGTAPNYVALATSLLSLASAPTNHLEYSLPSDSNQMNNLTKLKSLKKMKLKLPEIKITTTKIHQYSKIKIVLFLFPGYIKKNNKKFKTCIVARTQMLLYKNETYFITMICLQQFQRHFYSK